MSRSGDRCCSAGREASDVGDACPSDLVALVQEADPDGRFDSGAAREDFCGDVRFATPEVVASSSLSFSLSLCSW